MTRTVDAGTAKCVVWDLDNTLWNGILLESPHVELRSWVPEVIRTLDRRGIINSIASRNDHAAAATRLQQAGIWEYFVHPQINWGAKSASIERIAELLNVGIDTIAFVDDDQVERLEVAYRFPMVRCIDSAVGESIVDRSDMTPAHVTPDAAGRRQSYQTEIARRQAEEEFEGSSREFLATLDLRLTISRAQDADLERAAELTERTNQLNSTGITYSVEQLRQFTRSPEHLVLLVDLADRFGSYGKVGLTLLETRADHWAAKLILMSCRVASRGIGAVVVNEIRRLAISHRARLTADFRRNDRNRLMYMTYKFNGFTELSTEDGRTVFEADLSEAVPQPAYVAIDYVGVPMR